MIHVPTVVAEEWAGGVVVIENEAVSGIVLSEDAELLTILAEESLLEVEWVTDELVEVELMVVVVLGVEVLRLNVQVGEVAVIPDLAAVAYQRYVWPIRVGVYVHTYSPFASLTPKQPGASPPSTYTVTIAPCTAAPF
jgi:hypothetical protein